MAFSKIHRLTPLLTPLLVESRFTLQETRYFFYDGWNMVKELITNNQEPITTQTNSFVWGLDLSGSLQGAGGVGGLLCSVRSQSGSSEAFYPLYDHNGNVEKYIRQNGQVVAEFQYDGFGNTLMESIAQGLTPNAFSYRFSTKYWDAEVGLYYYGYRYYSPGLGRWINRDSYEENGGINLNAFVLNNAQFYYDYNGHMAQVIIIPVVAVVAVVAVIVYYPDIVDASEQILYRIAEDASEAVRNIRIQYRIRRCRKLYNKYKGKCSNISCPSGLSCKAYTPIIGRIASCMSARLDYMDLDCDQYFNPQRTWGHLIQIQQLGNSLLRCAGKQAKACCGR